MEEKPATEECPKCGRQCDYTPRPDTQHRGSIRCPEHGFLWLPKLAENRKPRRKSNNDLANLLPQHLRDFCWNCRRHRDELQLLRPVVVLQVHHIIEDNEGGPDTPENLQRLCAECHGEVHRRREAFRRYRGPS